MASGSLSRASWTDPVQRKLFIDLCLQEVNHGGRAGGTLRPASWGKVREEIKKQIGKEFSQKQLKNSWDYMKRQYFIWTRLVSAMGHGFNASTNTVDWPAEKCDQYFKTHKEAKKYWYKPLQNTSELTALFDGILDNGSDDEDKPNEEDNPNDNKGLATQLAKRPVQGANDNDSQTSTPSTSLSTSTPHSALNLGSDLDAQACIKRRKKDKKGNAVEWIKSLIAVLAKDADTGPTITDCTNSLNEMLTLAKMDDLYYVALNAFCEKKEYRELWMCLTDEEARIGWLRSITRQVVSGKSS